MQNVDSVICHAGCQCQSLPSLRLRQTLGKICEFCELASNIFIFCRSFVITF